MCVFAGQPFAAAKLFTMLLSFWLKMVVQVFIIYVSGTGVGKGRRGQVKEVKEV